jgi:hypothetical protein
MDQGRIDIREEVKPGLWDYHAKPKKYLHLKKIKKTLENSA